MFSKNFIARKRDLWQYLGESSLQQQLKARSSQLFFERATFQIFAESLDPTLQVYWIPLIICGMKPARFVLHAFTPNESINNFVFRSSFFLPFLFHTLLRTIITKPIRSESIFRNILVNLQCKEATIPVKALNEAIKIHCSLCMR